MAFLPAWLRVLLLSTERKESIDCCRFIVETARRHAYGSHAAVQRIELRQKAREKLLLLRKVLYQPAIK